MSNPTPSANVLVADDQSDVREALRLLLKGEGYAIETAELTGGRARGRAARPISTPSCST